jgi:hypothetical protein
MRSRMLRIFGALAYLIASVSSSSSYSNSSSSSSSSSSEPESDGSFAPVYTSRVRHVSQGNVLLLSSDSEVEIIDIVPAAPVRATAARRAPASAPNRGAPAPTPLSLPAATPVRSGAVRTPAAQQRTSMISASVVRPQSALNRPATSAHTLAHWLQHQVLDVGVYPGWTRLSHQCR